MAQILVIDDQEDIVKLVVKALELQNHKVTGFTSCLLYTSGNMYFSNQDSENAVYTGTVTYITEDEYPIEK